MEGAVTVAGLGVAVLILYEALKPAPPDAPFPKDFIPITPVIFKIDPPPPPSTPPDTPSWQISTDSFPMPMCAINVARPASAYGASWAPEMGIFDTKEKCLQGADAMTAAAPYLASWKNFKRDVEWEANYTNSPLSFFTGKVWTPGVPDTGCYYIDKATGNMEQGGCVGWVMPMGLPSQWGYAPSTR